MDFSELENAIKEAQKEAINNTTNDISRIIDKFINIISNNLAISDLALFVPIPTLKPKFISIHYTANNTIYNYEICIEDISRPSWYPKKYPDGVDLVSLFEFGYDTGGKHVYDGLGHSSLTYREGSFAIHAAVSDFNAMYGEFATAEIKF